MNEEAKKFKIVLSENADYSEVVDSVADVLKVGIVIESELEDGFQITDLLAALKIQSTVTEIVNDVPLFVSQFLALNKDTAKAAVIEARSRVLAEGKEFGKVTNWIMNFLYVAANSYGYAIETYMNGQNQYLLWQSLLKGGVTFPE